MAIAISVALETAPAQGSVAPAFSDFMVAPSRLMAAKPPDPSSHPEARTFRTVLRNGAKVGVPALGAEFRADSALLIVDSPETIRTDGIEPLRGSYLTQYWVWEEGRKTFRLLGEREDSVERVGR